MKTKHKRTNHKKTNHKRRNHKTKKQSNKQKELFGNRISNYDLYVININYIFHNWLSPFDIL